MAADQTTLSSPRQVELLAPSDVLSLAQKGNDLALQLFKLTAAGSEMALLRKDGNLTLASIESSEAGAAYRQYIINGTTPDIIQNVADAYNLTSDDVQKMAAAFNTDAQALEARNAQAFPLSHLAEMRFNSQYVEKDILARISEIKAAGADKIIAELKADFKHNSDGVLLAKNLVDRHLSQPDSYFSKLLNSLSEKDRDKVLMAALNAIRVNTTYPLNPDEQDLFNLVQARQNAREQAAQAKANPEQRSAAVSVRIYSEGEMHFSVLEDAQKKQHYTLKESDGNSKEIPTEQGAAIAAAAATLRDNQVSVHAVGSGSESTVEIQLRGLKKIIDSTIKRS